MKVTVLAALMVFAAYFLLLYAGVGFLQDKRFFGSAPKENLDAIPDRKERFPGAHAIGWVLATLALLLFLGGGGAGGVGRRPAGLRLRGVLRTLPGHPLRHGGLRHRFLRLGAALPLQFLPPLLPGAEGHRGASAVRLQQGVAPAALRALSPRQRPGSVALHTPLKKERRDRNGHAFSRFGGDPESIMRGLQGSLRSGG